MPWKHVYLERHQGVHAACWKLSTQASDYLTQTKNYRRFRADTRYSKSAFGLKNIPNCKGTVDKLWIIWMLSDCNSILPNHWLCKQRLTECRKHLEGHMLSLEYLEKYSLKILLRLAKGREEGEIHHSYQCGCQQVLWNTLPLEVKVGSYLLVFCKVVKTIMLEMTFGGWH